MLSNSLRTLFTQAIVARILEALPPVRATILERVFTGFWQFTTPLINFQELVDIARAIPLITRGGTAIPINKETLSSFWVEPYTIKPEDEISGQALNDYKVVLGNAMSLEAWRARKVDKLRRVTRLTCEGMAATALSGTLTWPVQLKNGGFDTYSIEFGSPLTFSPGTLWDNGGIKLAMVLLDLAKIEAKIQDEGYGSQVKFLAGDGAFGAVANLALASASTAKVRVEVEGNVITLGKYQVERCGETYLNPQTNATVAKIASTKLLGYATDANHGVGYAALDDLDAGLAPLPFFVKPIKTDDPSGFRLIGQSKPIPVPVVKALCWATVTSAQNSPQGRPGGPDGPISAPTLLNQVKPRSNRS